MSELIGFSTALINRAKQANVRYLIAVEGDLSWGKEVVQTFSSHYSAPLWAGDFAPEPIPSVSLKKAKKLLGQECDCLIYNAHQAFDAQALGALSGTVIGGGVLLMLVPPQWFSHTDTQLPFIRRLARLLSQSEIIRLRQNQPLPVLPTPCLVGQEYLDDVHGCLTAEQYEAVMAIRRVVTGHRKRPLVLTADRGRGKSTALGIAAASLMKERNIRIGVTAPAFANVDTLFSHVARRLNINYDQQKMMCFAEGQLQFFSPDALLADNVQLDFLIVDEAAAIPAPMLAGLLGQYNRVAFASTVHGYEGTGRGFAIKFRQLLDVVTPQWRQLRLTQPIRWAENDPLEKWTFKALLLDAEYASLDQVTEPKASIHYRVLPTECLIDDEARLSQLFGLLVNAHYQTSPADIVQLLDDDSIHLVVAESDDLIVGCCLLSLEGGFAPELAQQILLGKRRPKGHLLAQSITAHIGFEQGVIQRCARIMRIAVHPERQQQGIGLALLESCREWAQAHKLDYLGTSFGLVSELFDFWNKAGYTPVRLGVTKDAASGAHSLLAVLPLSTEANTWYDQAVRVFATNFQAQRYEQFSDLDSELFFKLYLFSLAIDTFPDPPMTALVEHQLRIFAQGGLGYDLVVSSLDTGLVRFLVSSDQTLSQELKFAIAKILQRQGWSKVIRDYDLASRKMAEKALREFVDRIILP